MTTIVKSKYKVSRRLGTSIWGDGKDPVHQKNYRPGQHGASGMPSKPSDYGLHLRAKQRLKAHYGRITEKQFRSIFKEAVRRKGNTGENFIGLLECRLDAFVYRAKLARSIFMARQMVSHGHFLVNGKKVNIPSYVLRIGDVVELRETSKHLPLVVESLGVQERHRPDYILFDEDKRVGHITRVPTSSDVPYPFDPEVQRVVEFYSK